MKKIIKWIFIIAVIIFAFWPNDTLKIMQAKAIVGFIIGLIIGVLFLLWGPAGIITMRRPDQRKYWED